MADKIGSIDMKFVERAKKEKRLLFVSWKDGGVYMSATRGPLTDEGRATIAKTVAKRKAKKQKLIASISKKMRATAERAAALRAKADALMRKADQI